MLETLTLLAILSLARPALAAPRASLPATGFDFGRIPQGVKVAHTFSLHNGGDSPLTIERVEMSMPGMTGRFPHIVASGADAAITVEWDTSHIQGKLLAEAKVLTNDPANPSISLELSGQVYGPLEIEPLPAVFLSTFHGEDVRRELTLRDNQSRPGAIHLEESRNAHFLASLVPVEPGRVWKVTVRAAPQTLPGHYEEALELESDDPAIGRVHIPVHLFVKADLYANPDEIDLGDVPLERVRRDPKVLQILGQNFFVKRREGTFRLLGLRSDVAALDLRATPSADASVSFQIDVALRPDLLRPGSLEGTIWADTDDPKFPRISIRVHGRVVER